MTPEEIRETLFRTLDKLDELYCDRSTAEELLRREREAHAQEVVNLRSELSSKDSILAEKDLCLAEKDQCLTEKERTLAEKDNRIASLEKALAESEAARTDADHKVSSMNQDKFQGTSKKGIDNKHQTKKGRDDNKDDFDGTPGSAGPQDTNSKKGENVEMISRSRSDIRRAQASARLFR